MVSSPPVDHAELSAWLARCDPYESIEPSDPRYVDLSKPVDDVELRGGDPVIPLYDHITLSGTTSCQLFSGFSGTGKTTELHRLANELEARGYAVLAADARDYHDLGRTIEIEDLMVVVAAAVGDATQKLVGKDVFQEGYYQRLKDFLSQEIKLEEIKISTAADLKLSVQHGMPFWLRARHALAGSPERLRGHAHAFIANALSTIRQKNRAPAGTVFILDGLEKLNPTEAQFLDVMTSLVARFTDFPGFLKLPDCHVVYTLSPYARLVRPKLRQHYRVTDVMPSMNVLGRGRQIVPFEPGIRALREVVGRRIPLDRTFENHEDLLDQLILYSGGHVRTLLLFLNELLLRAVRRGLPETKEDIEGIVQRTREDMQAALFAERLPLLEHLLVHESIDGLSEDELPRLAALMEDNIVQSYLNHERWYAVHPLVRPRLEQLLAESESRVPPSSRQGQGERRRM